MMIIKSTSMKCLVFVLLMLLPLSALAAGSTGKAVLASPGPGWELRATVPHLFLSIAALDESTAWASSAMSLFPGIFKTTDGGATWTLQTQEVFAKASVVDALTIYACSGSMVLKTTDGGTTWNTIFNDEDVFVTDICAFDASNVVGSGYINDAKGINRGYVARSSNGGATWSLLYLDPSQSSIGDLSAPSPEVIWVVDKRATDDFAVILRTIDGGANWNQVGSIYVYSWPFSLISAIDAKAAWAVSTQMSPDANGDILKTTDGGATWVSKYHFNDYLDAAAGVYGIDDDVCWTGCPWHEGLLKTADGGETWIDQPTSSYASRSISALNPCVAWAVGGYVTSLTDLTSDVFRTTDGGGPEPDVVSIFPDKGPEGTSVTINGCDFGDTQETSYVSFGEVVVTENTSWSDGQVEVNAPAGITSPAKVTVTTTEGTSNGKPFQVTGPAPTVSSIAPASAGQFALLVNVTVQGTGFQPGAALRLEKDGAVIFAWGVNVSSDTELTAYLLYFGANTGAWDVVVTNPDTSEGKLAEGFTVTPACGTGSASAVLMLGLVLGLLSLASSRKARRRRGK